MKILRLFFRDHPSPNIGKKKHHPGGDWHCGRGFEFQIIHWMFHINYHFVDKHHKMDGSLSPAPSFPIRLPPPRWSIQLHWPGICAWFLALYGVSTPPKSFINAKNDGLENVSPFKHGYFGVSMLDFRGLVFVNGCLLRPLGFGATFDLSTMANFPSSGKGLIFGCNLRLNTTKWWCTLDVNLRIFGYLGC